MENHVVAERQQRVAGGESRSRPASGLAGLWRRWQRPPGPIVEPGAPGRGPEVPEAGTSLDYDRVLAVEAGYSRRLARTVTGMLVVGVSIAALVFGWFPPGGLAGEGPVVLPAALTTSALSVIAAMAIAMQVAARQPKTEESEEEHLGRIRVIEGLAMLTGAAAVALVLGDLGRLAPTYTYLPLVVGEVAAGVFIAVVAADASLVTERRCGPDLRARRRAAGVGALAAAEERMQQAVGGVSAGRLCGAFVIVALGLWLVALGSSTLSSWVLWRCALSGATLFVMWFLVWARVREGFLSGERLWWASIGVLWFFVSVVLALTLVEAELHGAASLSEAGRGTAAVAVLFGGVFAIVMWAHRQARQGPSSLGDVWILWRLRRRIARSRAVSGEREAVWRGWLALALAFLVPPVGLAACQLVGREEGIAASKSERDLAERGWVAAVLGIVIWVVVACWVVWCGSANTAPS